MLPDDQLAAGADTPEETSVRVQRCLDRLLAGDDKARDDLINVAFGRLVKMMKRMSFGFRNIKSLDDTEGMVADASMRLWKALANIAPRTPRDFFGLAAQQMKWELLDLAKKIKSRQQHDLVFLGQVGDSSDEPIRISDDEGEPRRFLAWTEMHEKIDQLPDDLREVFTLKYYFELTNKDVGQILNISSKTVRHRWRDSQLKLHELLNGHWPEI